VTRQATTGNPLVIPGATHESCRGMTEGAIQAGHNVRGIGFGIHAGRCNTMAGRAIVHNAGVIERCRDEANGVMADTTVLVGRNMIDFFGCG